MEWVLLSGYRHHPLTDVQIHTLFYCAAEAEGNLTSPYFPFWLFPHMIFHYLSEFGPVPQPPAASHGVRARCPRVKYMGHCLCGERSWLSSPYSHTPLAMLVLGDSSDSATALCSGEVISRISFSLLVTVAMSREPWMK